MGKCQLLPTFHLNWVVGITPLFYQCVEDFEQGKDSILTDFFKIPQLSASFDEPDAITSSVLLAFLC